MNSDDIEFFFEQLKTQNPSPTTELNYTTPFELLISVMLSAQATDVSVNKATGPLFKIANTPEKLLALGTEKLESYIKTIGLYRTKAKHVIKTCEILLEKYHGEVPRTREALESLPGVGRKTANVILNTAFGEEAFAVDTHIFRVCNRTGLAPGKNPLAVEMGLIKTVPIPYRHDAHHWLILHGRYVCKARVPLCEECVISKVCAYYQHLRK